MPNNGMRVVIDTNIWISFLIGKSLAGLTDAIIANRVQVLFSDDLFSELLEVLQRPKLKKYFTSTAIEQLLALLYEKITWVNVVDEFTDCRDKKDNFLLNLLVSGHASYLITGIPTIFIGVEKKSQLNCLRELQQFILLALMIHRELKHIGTIALSRVVVMVNGLFLRLRILRLFGGVNLCDKPNSLWGVQRNEMLGIGTKQSTLRKALYGLIAKYINLINK